MSDCISGDENERIQKCYQMLLSLKQFQVAALEGGENMQQGILSKHDFYKQTKEANQVDRKLKWIKKRCVKWLKKWCNTVSEEAVIQNSILYKNHHFWVPENMITEFLWFTHNEPPNSHQEWDWIKN